MPFDSAEYCFSFPTASGFWLWLGKMG